MIEKQSKAPDPDLLDLDRSRSNFLELESISTTAHETLSGYHRSKSEPSHSGLAFSSP